MVMVMVGAQHPANNARNDVMMMVVVVILSGLNAAGSRFLGKPRIISLQGRDGIRNRIKKVPVACRLRHFSRLRRHRGLSGAHGC